MVIIAYIIITVSKETPAKYKLRIRDIMQDAAGKKGDFSTQQHLIIILKKMKMNPRHFYYI